MKDKEARLQTKRVESKSDKMGKRLEVEIRAGQSKDDKERARLIEQIQWLQSQVDGLSEKLTLILDFIDLKWRKVTKWEERETEGFDKP